MSKRKSTVRRSLKMDNMKPISIDPEAYAKHEQATKDHVRIHRETERERDKSARGGA